MSSGGRKRHLSPYLPSHPVVSDLGNVGRGQSVGPVAASPFGSASILPISWAYIKLMGSQGLRRASQVYPVNWSVTVYS